MKLETPEGRAFVEALERLRPAGRLRPAHVGRIGPRLLPDLRAAAQSGHERRHHEDHEGRVVSVRDEEHQGRSTGGTRSTTAAPGRAARRGRGGRRTRARRRGRRRRGRSRRRSGRRRRRRRDERRADTRGRRRARRRPGRCASWNTFEHVPRYHNNYVGMRNRFALLSEAYAYATFEDRIKATNYFLEEALNFANANADRLKKAVEAADKESIVGKTEGTRAQFKRGGVIDVLMGEVEDEKNPVNGADDEPPQGRRPRRADDRHALVRADARPRTCRTSTTCRRARPRRSSCCKRTASRCAAHRAGHAASSSSRSRATRSGRQPATRSTPARTACASLDGDWQAAAADVTVPAGAWAVPMNQPLARLAFYLLAPTSDDGLTTWNYLDDLLGGTRRRIRS